MTKSRAKQGGLTSRFKKRVTNRSNLQVFVNRIRKILDESRHRALQTVNAAMVSAYWEVGREIVQEEQKGQNRASYGDELLAVLSRELVRDYGKGFSPRNLLYIRNFYLAYPKSQALLAKLSWTHYRLLSEIEKTEARTFYEGECIRANWSTRELERQINSLLYERLLRTKDKRAFLGRLQPNKSEKFTPRDIIRDPYILEFTGLPESTDYLESDLEVALVDKLQHFLLELGKGFAFLGRQKRISVDGDHFYIDLVFYHTILKCFVLIDLKAAKITHSDLGQMQFYVNYYDEEIRSTGDQPTIGIILGTDKNEAVVRYTLSKQNKRIFASRYKMYLPSENELAKELKRERAQIELEARIRPKRKK